MRSEREMFDLILETAEQDSRIRAVLLSGSRANPNAWRDIFQDFDIVYLVTEIESFLQSEGWIDRFGEIMILQTPEAMSDPPAMNDGGFAYLMQFTDGNRIDLTLFPIAGLAGFKMESSTRLLLDKDHLVDPPPPSDRDYLPTPPTAKAFADCCNEFWWVCPYVAKGLWRAEILYAKFHLDQVLREQLMKMLVWYDGALTGFSRSSGKFGKYMQDTLDTDLWALLEKTYSTLDYPETWDALLTMGELFRKVASFVAGTFGFEYPQKDDQRVTAHLIHVRVLPRTAREIY
jgi:aminoglycoside 6-adenylyltransferase